MSERTTLNPSDAVYGFAAWLTTREEETIMSAHHDSAIIADLVKRFCVTNDLPDVTDRICAFKRNI